MVDFKAQIQAYAEETAGFGSWTWDPDTDQTSYSDNMFRLLGLEPGEIVPILGTAAAYAHPDDQHAFLDRAAVLGSSEDQESEYRVRAQDGSERVFSERSRMISMEDARLRIGITRDVTERKRFEAEVLRTQDENQRVLREKHDLEEGLRADLLKATLNAQESEQRRIAESLHNGMGQMLYGIQLHLEQLALEPGATWEARHAERQVSTQGLLREAMAEARRISHELMPSVLEDFGIKAALENICKRLSSTLEFHCETHDLPDRIEQYLELMIYRSMQELITNSLRHGGATCIRVALRRAEGAYHFEVRDNGRGCDPGTRTDGIGLRTIRNKVALLNGDFAMESGDTGTVVRIRVPDGAGTPPT